MATSQLCTILVRDGLAGSDIRPLPRLPATATRGVSSKNSRSFTPRPADPTTVAFSLNRSELSGFPALASVLDAYHRALDITAVQFHRMLRDDFSALKEKHADAVYKMMTDRGADLTTYSEAEKEVLWLTLVEEVRKGGMRLPA